MTVNFRVGVVTALYVLPLRRTVGANTRYEYLPDVEGAAVRNLKVPARPLLSFATFFHADPLRRCSTTGRIIFGGSEPLKTTMAAAGVDVGEIVSDPEVLIRASW